MLRRATEEDFDAILDMSEKFWQQTQFEEEFERDHCMDMVKLAHDHELLAVLEVDGKVEGFCAAIKGPALASMVTIGVELAWWVNPEHRGGRNGIALMNYMEKLAKDAGVKYWNMISMQSSMEVGSIYERLGYKKAETTYTKVI